MDISADLMELGRTPVAVVCAGVKSILDIEKTLEVLVLAILSSLLFVCLVLQSLLSRKPKEYQWRLLVTRTTFQHFIHLIVGLRYVKGKV